MLALYGTVGIVAGDEATGLPTRQTSTQEGGRGMVMVWADYSMFMDA